MSLNDRDRQRPRRYGENQVPMLSPSQMTTLRTLMGRIIPADDDPGAWEAGVGDYLLRQLSGDLRPVVDSYRAGLDALEAEAKTSAGASLAALSPAEQDALMRRIESGA